MSWGCMREGAEQGPARAGATGVLAPRKWGRSGGMEAQNSWGIRAEEGRGRERPRPRVPNF